MILYVYCYIVSMLLMFNHTSIACYMIAMKHSWAIGDEVEILPTYCNIDSINLIEFKLSLTSLISYRDGAD